MVLAMGILAMKVRVVEMITQEDQIMGDQMILQYCQILVMITTEITLII